ncbi:hypothetical protein [Aerosakkonema funiforme]|uniref:hypothetical protein n=1 Tax=Aerosakkonema funiforme TaxID=1246630 RepID=UPI0035B6D98D
MNTTLNNPKAKIGPQGTWTITAARSSNDTPYSGTVQILPMGKIYSISWLTTLGDYSGLAFFEDDRLFAACGPDNTYGVSLYKINGDGTLDCRWITPSNKGAIDTEKAVGGTPNELEGSYQVRGTISNLGDYEGTLNISKLSDTYQILWSMGVEYQGVGLRVGDWLVVGWGEGNVYCLDYKIQGDLAQGRWAYLGKSTLGVETLQRIC